MPSTFFLLWRVAYLILYFKASRHTQCQGAFVFAHSGSRIKLLPINCGVVLPTSFTFANAMHILSRILIAGITALRNLDFALVQLHRRFETCYFLRRALMPMIFQLMRRININTKGRPFSKCFADLVRHPLLPKQKRNFNKRKRPTVYCAVFVKAALFSTIADD